ncbi:RNA methyltransferase [Alkalicaulis satelles]|uniref:RNA methyltransferase n=1 Tax=Alkalicaulis satelles TaxID=2609175 RepID=A0A5M6ZGU8_9PROT|nr:RNA methyltransferase [Alkalicaulis satelles]KAA5803992.1 RNA methyltransferase [Alkalicaulis satelles]
MRGYFAVGLEGVSKAMNLGAVMRTAHAFGAHFVFTLGAEHRAREIAHADTSRTQDSVPAYHWQGVEEMRLPRGCQLVGVELTDDAVPMPSFRHPHAAAYVFGSERGDLSEDLLARCAHVVKIPTRFCLNLSMAAAITLYDRTLCLGGFAERPVRPGGPHPAPPHTWGAPRKRT